MVPPVAAPHRRRTGDGSGFGTSGEPCRRRTFFNYCMGLCNLVAITLCPGLAGSRVAAHFQNTVEYEQGCGANPRGHKQLVQLGGAGGLIINLLQRVCNCAADIFVRVTACRQARRAGVGLCSPACMPLACCSECCDVAFEHVPAQAVTNSATRARLRLYRAMDHGAVVLRLRPEACGEPAWLRFDRAHSQSKSAPATFTNKS